MQPGDILSHTSYSGITRRWRVLGIHPGGSGQESVIEIVSDTYTKPTAYGETLESMFVPEVLTRSLDNRSERARLQTLALTCPTPQS